MNRLNMDRLMRALSEIVSEKFGVKVVFTATPKNQMEGEDVDAH